MCQVLQNDGICRKAGLDDAEFDELGERLSTRRAQFGCLLAQGNSLNHGLLFLCGPDFNPDENEAKRVS